MSHNNYFTTIKRRIHQHMNNRVGPLVFFRKTENHQIFFSQPTFIGSDSAKYFYNQLQKLFQKPGITPHTFENPPKLSFNRGKFIYHISKYTG